jgi:glycosyltransferase involved in cell wall biosynthesis
MNERKPRNRIRVCHIAHGDLWAGAEVQLASLLAALLTDSRFELSAILLNDGKLGSEIRSLGIPLAILDERKHTALEIVRRMGAILRHEPPHIIHTHKYKDNILACSALIGRSHPSVVRTVHGITELLSGKAFAKMLFYGLVDRILISWRVGKVIAVSSEIHSLLCRRYTSDKVIRIHNGINLHKISYKRDRYSVRRSLGIAGDECIVGAVGRLTRVKGHDELLRAFRLLKESIVHSKCLIVGDGPLMSELTLLARTLGIANDVIFVGHRDDVYDLINCMDIFVLPSLHEGIPMVLLEALALGKPVIASSVGGVPEVVSHGKTGLLVKPGSAKELVQSMTLLIREKAYGDVLSKAGQELVLDRFSATQMANQTAAVYCSLVKGIGLLGLHKTKDCSKY